MYNFTLPITRSLGAPDWPTQHLVYSNFNTQYLVSSARAPPYFANLYYVANYPSKECCTKNY